MITDRIAPNCIAMVNVFVKGSEAIPKNDDTMIMWPVDETGRNSVSPSTMAKMIASKIDMNNYFSSLGEYSIAMISTINPAITMIGLSVIPINPNP